MISKLQIVINLFLFYRFPYAPSCFADYGGPVVPELIFGGIDTKKQIFNKIDAYRNASALILTFLVNNHFNKVNLEPALQWELEFINFMKNWTKNSQPDYMDVAFSSERSIEDEIDRSSHSDVFTILISYVTMFLYISLSLGDWTSFSNLIINSRTTLGVGGVLIVLTSVLSSVALCSSFGKSDYQLKYFKNDRRKDLFDFKHQMQKKFFSKNI